MSDKPILYVVTSNAVKGASGQPTGFWLSELTHPMHETEAAGHRSEIAAIRAGVAPVDADSLNMDDPVNAHYWQQTDLQQRLQAAPGLGGLNGADYSAILFTGGYGTMWDFRENLMRNALSAKCTKTAVSLPPSATALPRWWTRNFLMANIWSAAKTLPLSPTPKKKQRAELKSSPSCWKPRSLNTAQNTMPRRTGRKTWWWTAV